jgi:hypothetical protein
MSVGGLLLKSDCQLSPAPPISGGRGRGEGVSQITPLPPTERGGAAAASKGVLGGGSGGGGVVGAADVAAAATAKAVATNAAAKAEWTSSSSSQVGTTGASEAAVVAAAAKGVGGTEGYVNGARLPVGLLAPVPGALLQSYRSAAADAIDMAGSAADIVPGVEFMV